jgi:hypothetical protein
LELDGIVDPVKLGRILLKKIGLLAVTCDEKNGQKFDFKWVLM